FIYMYISEIPLHQVSIASLIISLSLLVANGIVANDNINVYLERGMDRFTACTKGIYEVKIPILTSTLTTVASFLPLAMMQGSAGKFVKSLPILVSVALMGSYLTSLTLVPVMGHRLLKVEEEDVEGKKLKTKIVRALKLDGFSKGVLNYYGKSLGSFLKRPLVLI
ncbi:efflux RND transporter permease subunit, partial [Coprococcus sp. MSK.21.13]|nr:efflux RND transporter permease subunit [Bacteroidales bacterium MSK.15.36]NSJ92957.1 efflux RND transporter permease subunit [Coprococcus sp. MSK.21.13]